MINWWDGDGARRTLAELKDLGLTTFWLPLKPGKGDDGKPDRLQLAGDVPRVGGDRGERSPGVAPHRRVAARRRRAPTTASIIGMLHNVAPFREMFGRYVFGGILDRNPGLRVGWFEGGINWVPAALQDAEHLYASLQHMADHPMEHERRGTTGSTHMYASFMVDPLGLELIDRIGVDRVMWSSDYPHNESTFGYSEQSLAAVVEAVGPEDAVKIVSTNVLTYLGLEA